MMARSARPANGLCDVCGKSRGIDIGTHLTWCSIFRDLRNRVKGLEDQLAKATNPEPDRKWLLDQVEAVAKEREGKPEHRRVPPLEIDRCR